MLESAERELQCNFRVLRKSDKYSKRPQNWVGGFYGCKELHVNIRLTLASEKTKF